MKRDGVDEKVAKSRIAAQMPLKEKMERATFLVDNNHGKDDAIKQLNAIADQLESSWIPLILRSGFGIILAILALSIFKYIFWKVYFTVKSSNKEFHKLFMINKGKKYSCFDGGCITRGMDKEK